MVRQERERGRSLPDSTDSSHQDVQAIAVMAEAELTAEVAQPVDSRKRPGASNRANERKAPEMLTQEQLEKFIESTQDHPLYALWVTAITSGMRKAELSGLRWSDLDFDSGIIHINQVAQSVHKQGILFSEPKTEKSRRSIDLPQVAVAALRLHKQKEEGIRASVRECKNFRDFRRI